jgi:hypothetical protein
MLNRQKENELIMQLIREIWDRSDYDAELCVQVVEKCFTGISRELAEYYLKDLQITYLRQLSAGLVNREG